MASDSESEEDVHKCGRCKAEFHDIDEFVAHRKAKTCQKNKPVKSDPDVLSSPQPDSQYSVTEVCFQVKTEPVTPSEKTKPKRKAKRKKVVQADVLESDNDEFDDVLYIDQQREEQTPSTGTGARGTRRRATRLPAKYRDDDENKTKSAKKPQIKLPQQVNDVTPARGRSKQYQCEQCAYCVGYKDEYDRHMRKVHNVSAYTCTSCNKLFRDNHKLQLHLKASKVCGVKTEPCDYNETASFDVSQDTVETGNISEEDHITTHDSDADPEFNPGNEKEEKHDDELKFPCYECRKEYLSYLGVYEHVKEHHPDISPGICRFCGMWFSSKYKLIRHVMSIVHDDVADQDLLTAKENAEQSTIKWQQKIKGKSGRVKISQHKCQTCGKQLQSKNMLEKHIKLQHSDGTQSQECPQCHKIFYTRKQFVRHMREVHGITKSGQSCKICDKYFLHSHQVQRHMECMHAASQQIPVEEITQLEGEEWDQEPETITINMDALNSEGDLTISLDNAKYSCCVCMEAMNNKRDYVIHMQMHRIWIPDPITGAKHVKGDHGLGKVPGQQVEAEKAGETEDIPEKQAAGQSNVTVVFDESTEGLEGSRQDEEVVFRILREMQQSMRTEALGLNDMVEDGELVASKQPQNFVTFFENCLDNNQAAVDPIATCTLSGDTVTIEEVHVTGNSPKPTDTEGAVESGKESLLCPYCLRCFDSLVPLYNHKIKYHNLQAVFQCIDTHCLDVFYNHRDYVEHAKTHPQKAYICLVCNLHFPEINMLFLHKSQAHKNIRNSHTAKSCLVCAQLFKTPEELLDHEEKMHSELKCKICSKLLRTKATLMEHMAQHTGIKPFLCHHCGSTFASKLALNRHSLLHDPNREYKCEECGQIFHKMEHVRRHKISKHSDEKPFKCDWDGCTKAFKRSDKLKEHRKMHMDAKDYVCEQCGKAYRYRDGLKYHEKTHERDDKYFCEICNAGFYHHARLKDHMKTIHNKKMKDNHVYPCHICHIKCLRPERLKRHVEREHQLTVNWEEKCPHCNRGFAGKRSLETHINKRHKGKKRRADGEIEIRPTPQRKRTDHTNDIQWPTDLHSYQQNNSDLLRELPLDQVITVPPVSKNTLLPSSTLLPSGEQAPGSSAAIPEQQEVQDVTANFHSYQSTDTEPVTLTQDLQVQPELVQHVTTSQDQIQHFLPATTLLSEQHVVAGNNSLPTAGYIVLNQETLDQIQQSQAGSAIAIVNEISQGNTTTIQVQANPQFSQNNIQFNNITW